MQAIDLNFLTETKPESMRVCSLHAFAYCPRLFYLEEVEELYTQDAAVFAGRRLLAQSLDSLLGFEGKLAALYFSALPCLLGQDIPAEMGFSGRNRRPPKDSFNCLLSFGYALLIKDVMNAILAVGLEPALGFYHQPRTQAPPLALDLMEIFRVPLVDMAVMASINRHQWEVEADFTVRGKQVWLSDAGRRKFVHINLDGVG